MALIKSKRYPEADTYVGYIHHTADIFQTTRFSGLDSTADKIISTVETEMSKASAHLLEIGVYSEKTWWGIIPTYTLTVECKYYLPGESLGTSFPIPAIVWAILAILALIAFVYYTKRKFDIIEKYGYAPWYSGIFGGVTLLIIAGAGAFLTIKYLVPYLSKKME